jgi:hypothetical protein
LEEQEVIGFLIIALYLIAITQLLGLWVGLRIVRSGLERINKIIEEIKRMNRLDD